MSPAPVLTQAKSSDSPLAEVPASWQPTDVVHGAISWGSTQVPAPPRLDASGGQG